MQRASDSAAVEPPRSLFQRVLEFLEIGVSGVLVGGAFALVTVTVLLRAFAPDSAPKYTEEVTVYMVVWAVLIACGGVTSHREHVRADLVVAFMKPAWQFLCDLVSNSLGVAFAIFMIYYGYQVAYEAYIYNDLSASHVRFPLWIYYASLPVAAVLMGLGHLGVVFGLLTGRLKPASTGTETEQEVKKWEE